MKTVIGMAILFYGLAFGWGVNSMERDKEIALPKPSVDGDVSLESAIHERRSVREFSKQSLSLADVAQLLWAAQGITSRDGGRYTRIETGHAAQNVYLQATALGLGTVIVGAFQDEEVQDVLGLPGDHAPLALLPVGHRR
jgi:nitroreductase